MMERFAGDNAIMQKMAADLERQRQLDKQYLAKVQRDSDEQTRRDVAAVYGVIIPFA